MLKSPVDGLLEEVKQLKAENADLRSELLRLEGLEKHVHLLQEEIDQLEKENTALKLQTMIFKPADSSVKGTTKTKVHETATQFLLDSSSNFRVKEGLCESSDNVSDTCVNENPEDSCRESAELISETDSCGLVTQRDTVQTKRAESVWNDQRIKTRRGGKLKKAKRSVEEEKRGRSKERMNNGQIHSDIERMNNGQIHSDSCGSSPAADLSAVCSMDPQHSKCQQQSQPPGQQKCVSLKKTQCDGAKAKQAKLHAADSRLLKNCPECSFTTLHSKSLWRHVRNRHRGQRYKCQYCSKEYHYESGLKTHVETIHTKELDICSVCGLSMHRSRLKYHVQSVHHGTGNFTCELCGKFFEKKSCYVGHINKHFDVKQFQCENCGKTFFYETSLYGHKKNCLKQISKKAQKLNTAPSVFICDVCAKEFKTVCAMREHVQAKHSDSNYECVCGRTYSWRPSFKRHERKCKVFLSKTENESVVTKEFE